MNVIQKMSLNDFNHAINALECALIRLTDGLEYITLEDAPNTFKSMKAFYQQHGCLGIYTGGMESTIYTEPRFNILFRAWHDSIHLESNLKFTLEDETKTALEHLRQVTLCLGSMGYGKGVIKHVQTILWADTALQVSYYYKHGQFVTDQRQFVLKNVVYNWHE